MALKAQLLADDKLSTLCLLLKTIAFWDTQTLLFPALCPRALDDAPLCRPLNLLQIDFFAPYSLLVLRVRAPAQALALTLAFDHSLPSAHAPWACCIPKPIFRYDIRPLPYLNSHEQVSALAQTPNTKKSTSHHRHDHFVPPARPSLRLKFYNDLSQLVTGLVTTLTSDWCFHFDPS